MTEQTTQPTFDFETPVEIGSDTVRVCTARSDGSVWYVADDIRRICHKPRGSFRGPCRRYTLAMHGWGLQLVTHDAVMRFIIQHSPLPVHVWTDALGDW